MNRNEEEIEDAPAWYTKDDNKENKKIWGDTVNNYVATFEINVEDQDFDQTLVNELIPVIARKDKRWVGFDLKKFNTKLFKTHRELYSEVRRVWCNLQAQT